MGGVAVTDAVGVAGCVTDTVGVTRSGTGSLGGAGNAVAVADAVRAGLFVVAFVVIFAVVAVVFVVGLLGWLGRVHAATDCVTVVGAGSFGGGGNAVAVVLFAGAGLFDVVAFVVVAFVVVVAVAFVALICFPGGITLTDGACCAGSWGTVVEVDVDVVAIVAIAIAVAGLVAFVVAVAIVFDVAAVFVVSGTVAVAFAVASGAVPDPMGAAEEDSCCPMTLQGERTLRYVALGRLFLVSQSVARPSSLQFRFVPYVTSLQKVCQLSRVSLRYYTEQ
jgi:hypothetical protein